MIDGFKSHAGRRQIIMLSDITGGYFIHTNKKTYLYACEQLLRDSVRYTAFGTVITITLWKSQDVLWLEIKDFQSVMGDYYREHSAVKQFERIGGVVTTINRERGKREIAIGFDLA